MIKSPGDFFDVYYTKVKIAKACQIQVVVGLKVSKKAVIRNRLRRRIKEILRLSRPGLQVVRVVAKPLAVGVKYDNLKKDLEKATSGS